MARRKTSPGDENPAAPTFEEALAGLEAIVESMEHEQLPLEELVASYEQGAKLLQHCEGILDSARQRIELITLRQNEPAATAHEQEPADPAGQPDLTTSLPEDSDSDDDDDIRLF